MSWSFAKGNRQAESFTQGYGSPEGVFAGEINEVYLDLSGPTFYRKSIGGTDYGWLPIIPSGTLLVSALDLELNGGDWRGAEADDVTNFSRLFAMQTTPILSPSTGTRTLQMQELHMLDDPDDSNKMIGFYSAWKDVNASETAIWRCEASKLTPNILVNHTEILTAADAGIGYLRLTSVVWDGTNYHFFLTANGDSVWHGISATGTSITVDGVPFLDTFEAALNCTTTDESTTVTTATTAVLETGMVVSGTGIPEGATITVIDGTSFDLSEAATASDTVELTFYTPSVISLFSAFKDGSTWRGIYCYNAATPDAHYRYATSSDGLTWTKAGVTLLIPSVGSDSGGLEFSNFSKVGSNYVITYEAWSGTHWGAHVAYCATPDGTYTKLGAVLTHNADSTFATAHIATPTIRKIGATWTMYFQGSNTTSPATGNGGPWALGYSTLNPA